MRLKFEIRHDETPEDLVLRLNPESLLFEPQTDEAAQISLVVSVVREHGAADAETVAERCRKTRQWASEWLGRAADQGRLNRRGGRPVIFYLPAQPPETRVNVTPEAVVVSTNTAEHPALWVNDEQVVTFQ